MSDDSATNIPDWSLAYSLICICFPELNGVDNYWVLESAPLPPHVIAWIGKNTKWDRSTESYPTSFAINSPTYSTTLI